ncbi:MAG: diadenylate cyclase [Candidatus Moduliflexus flocculans]|nr:diadenylate cyclase [Candidatus Moduliflexus flocculans]
MAITGMVIVAVVLVTRRRKEPLVAKDTPKAFAARAGPLLENRPSLEELTTICSGTGVEPEVLDAVIQVAAEIAREGREGQAIGTAFVVGDTKNVLNYSKQFVLNPFHGHQEAERQITDAGIQGTIKEFAQLDGAFLITGNGVVEAAGRCITVDMSQVNLPGGWVHGTSSVAGITKVTNIHRDRRLAERRPDLHFPQREDRVCHRAVRWRPCFRSGDPASRLSITTNKETNSGDARRTGLFVYG